MAGFLGTQFAYHYNFSSGLYSFLTQYTFVQGFFLYSHGKIVFDQLSLVYSLNRLNRTGVDLNG